MKYIVPPITEARCPTCLTVYRCSLSLRMGDPHCRYCGKRMRWEISPPVATSIPHVLPEWVA